VNDNGVVVGYERSLSPEMIQKLKKNDHLGEMVGAWAGRHVEEAMAEEFNRRHVKALHDIWQRDKAKRGDEFIDLSDPAETSQIQ
jgi:hypothetical protein